VVLELDTDFIVVDIAPSQASQPTKTTETAPENKKEEETAPATIEEASKPTVIESEPETKPTEAPVDAKKEEKTAAPATTTA
jgi:hypothetical protein